MSLLNKPIEEVITTLYNSIKSKREIISDFKGQYGLNNNSTPNKDNIEIVKLKLIDLLDEFEITISQSLQCIQTLQAEICNLKENIQEQSFKALSIQAPSSIAQNEDFLIESINPINAQTNATNISTTSQVYHKPKLNVNKSSTNKLNFDYSTIMAGVNCSNLNSIQNTNRKDDDISVISEIKHSEDDKMKEPEVECARVPIRQNIISAKNNSSSFMNNNNQSLIANSKMNLNVNDSFSNISSKREVLLNKVSQMEKEKRVKKLLDKICNIKSYKIYLGDKYGNGKYEVFIKKIKNNEIDINALEKELKIISDLVETDTRRRNLITANEVKKKRTYSKERANTSMNNHNSNNSEYIAPVNLANILRGGDHKKSLSKKRSNSKK